jgi:hypothetical protein
VYSEPLELELYQFQELTVKALDERNDFEISVHSGLVFNAISCSSALASRDKSPVSVGFAGQPVALVV